MMIAVKAIDTPLSPRIGKIGGIIHFTISAPSVIHSLFIVVLLRRLLSVHSVAFWLSFCTAAVDSSAREHEALSQTAVFVGARVEDDLVIIIFNLVHWVKSMGLRVLKHPEKLL